MSCQLWPPGKEVHNGGMINNSATLRPLSNQHTFNFKVRGTPRFYDELNHKTHLRNREEIRKEYISDRKNREEILFEKAENKQIKLRRTALDIASEKETARYLKLLNAM